MQGRKFTILSAEDISNEKPRESLERVLFEDLLRVSDDIRGSVAELKAAPSERAASISDTLSQLTALLADGLDEHRLLTDAERETLRLAPASFHSEALARELVAAHRGPGPGTGPDLTLAADTQDCCMTTDRTVLKQVPVHMVRSAV